jgi:sugar-specific transcriptional regulator TrmB
VDKLHNNKNCSQFIHDVLNAIEKEMLVVLSKDRKRSSSAELREKFEVFYDRCMNDVDQDYCTKGIPAPLPRFARTSTAVEAFLNETAEKLMDDHPPDLEIETHSGKIRKSMLPSELAKIDDI